MIDYKLKIVRADAILTTSYVAGTVLEDLERDNQLMLYIEAVKGNVASFQVKVEYSYDGVTYCQQSFESVSGGVNTVSAGVFSFTLSGDPGDQNFVLAIPIKASKIKISTKGTGTITSSSVKITAAIGKV